MSRNSVALAATRDHAPVPEVDARIDVTAQLLAIEPGIYSVQLGAGAINRTEGGMVLPCARLDPLPGSAVETHFASLSLSSLMLPGAHPGFLRVDGASSVLLTIYKLAGSRAAPEFRIRYVAPAGAPPSVSPEQGMVSLPCRLTVHVERLGDLPVAGGAWGEAPGGVAAIEGFSLAPDDPLLAQALEYQAVLGNEWFSPWSGAGEFCGSRGLALPILGVRVRLRGNAEKTTRCVVWAKAGGAEIGPFEGDQLAGSGGLPLTALRVALIPRAADEADAGETTQPKVRPVRRLRLRRNTEDKP